MHIFHGEDIVGHFLVWVVVHKCLNNLTFKIKRIYDLNFGLLFLMSLANFTHIWVGAGFGFKGARAVAVKAAFRILSYMTRARAEYRLPYLLCLVVRRKG